MGDEKKPGDVIYTHKYPDEPSWWRRIDLDRWLGLLVITICTALTVITLIHVDYKSGAEMKLIQLEARLEYYETTKQNALLRQRIAEDNVWFKALAKQHRGSYCEEVDESGELLNPGLCQFWNRLDSVHNAMTTIP